jgi:triosephosphate isomerase (TIM)
VATLTAFVVADPNPHERLMVCPPATLIMSFAALADGVAIGGQDCHCEPAGAFTGDISAEMLADLGASVVIAGHSERRSYHRETDDEVRRKIMAAWRAGLLAILCVGESQDDRVGGRTLNTVGAQLQGSLPDRTGPARTISRSPMNRCGRSAAA